MLSLTSPRQSVIWSTLSRIINNYDELGIQLNYDETLRRLDVIESAQKELLAIKSASTTSVLSVHASKLNDTVLQQHLNQLSPIFLNAPRKRQAILKNNHFTFITNIEADRSDFHSICWLDISPTDHGDGWWTYDFELPNMFDSTTILLASYGAQQAQVGLIYTFFKEHNIPIERHDEEVVAL